MTEWHELHHPEGWHLCMTDCPSILFPESLDEIDDLLLSEDWFYFIKGNGKTDTMITIGWFPEEDLDGKYVVQVIVDGCYEEPEEMMASRDPKEIDAWIQEVAARY